MRCDEKISFLLDASTFRVINDLRWTYVTFGGLSTKNDVGVIVLVMLVFLSSGGFLAEAGWQSE